MTPRFETGSPGHDDRCARRKDEDWTRAKLPTGLDGVGPRLAETFKGIVLAVAEKKTEPQTERTEANLTCRICSTDEQEKRKLQIMNADVLEGGDGRLSLENDQKEEVLQRLFRENVLRRTDSRQSEREKGRREKRE